MSILRTFFLESSFHGFHFIFEKDRHWTEKVFWLICVLASWIASGYLIIASWNDYKHNAISFVVETDYLDWNTEFPSVSVCEDDDLWKINGIAENLYGKEHDYTYDEIIKELVYYKGLAFHTINYCGPNALPKDYCLKNNFSYFSWMVRKTCNQLFLACKWNNIPFNCCEYFYELDTELGVCYAINSAQVRNFKYKKFPMISNKTNGPATLFIEIYRYVNIYIIGEQDVPSFTTLQQDILAVAPQIHYKKYIAIKEIDNDDEVRDVSIAQRNCRFKEENNLDIYRYYSYSACSVQCRKDAQIKYCNCTHHQMPNTPFEQQCEIEGLACLNDNYFKLSALKTQWSKSTGLVCDCLPSCTEREIFTIKDEKAGYYNVNYTSVIEIILEQLPSEKYKRNVVRGKLDLVVSMGGTAALFMGASLLSFVEILYYFGPRFFWDSCLNRRKIIKKSKTSILHK